MIRIVAHAVLLIGVACCQSGCLMAVGALAFIIQSDGPDGGGLREGWLEETIPVPIAQAHEAALIVLDANALSLQSTATEKASRILSSRYGNDLDIRIELHEISSGMTQVRILVGPEGHLERSAHLMDSIRGVVFPDPAR